MYIVHCSYPAATLHVHCTSVWAVTPKIWPSVLCPWPKHHDPVTPVLAEPQDPLTLTQDAVTCDLHLYYCNWSWASRSCWVYNIWYTVPLDMIWPWPQWPLTLTQWPHDLDPVTPDLDLTCIGWATRPCGVWSIWYPIPPDTIWPWPSDLWPPDLDPVTPDLDLTCMGWATRPCGVWSIWYTVPPDTIWPWPSDPGTFCWGGCCCGRPRMLFPFIDDKLYNIQINFVSILFYLVSTGYCSHSKKIPQVGR